MPCNTQPTAQARSGTGARTWLAGGVLALSITACVPVLTPLQPPSAVAALMRHLGCRNAHASPPSLGFRVAQNLRPLPTMELRSGTTVGQALLASMRASVPCEMPAASRPHFEAGASLLFAQWTALRLAVENEWGGAASKEKEAWLLREAVAWCYRAKGGCWGAGGCCCCVLAPVQHMGPCGHP